MDTETKVLLNCKECNQQIGYDLIDLEKTLDKCYSPIAENNLQILIMTDCSNVFASLTSYQPRITDRSMKILIYYLRDNMSRVAFSSIDNGWNIADVGTKEKSNLSKWKDITNNNLSEIGFLG